MRLIAVHLIMKCMVDRDLIVAVITDSVCQQPKPSSMSRAIIASRMLPARCDEEVCMDGFVQQRVDCIGSWSVFEQPL
jgi:hypothetical protein